MDTDNVQAAIVELKERNLYLKLDLINLEDCIDDLQVQHSFIVDTRKHYVNQCLTWF